MAKIIYNEGEISGKLGGKVYSRNRWGPYVRELAVPVNPRTSFQTTARGNLADIAGTWRQLTPAQRLAWQAIAGTIVRTGRLGEVLQYNAYTAFMLLNGTRAVCGQSVLEDPPDLWFGPNPTSIDISVAAGAFSLDAIHVGGTSIVQTPAGMVLILDSCPHQSAGADYPKTWRTFITYPPATMIAKDITTDWEARFGAVGGAGRRYFLRLSWLMIVDNPAPTQGYVSVRVNSSCIST